jgi:type I restriction enzyme R subunit
MANYLMLSFYVVQKKLRKALLKYKLHRDQAFFDRAYAYIKDYY